MARNAWTILARRPTRATWQSSRSAARPRQTHRPGCASSKTCFRLDRPDGVDEAAAFRGALANELRVAGWPWREAQDRARKAIPDPPADQPVAEAGSAGTLADLPPPTPAIVVAHNAFYAGKLLLAHGPSGGGKTTYFGQAAAAVTTGSAHLARPTVEGDVVICTEDVDTWRDVVGEQRGDLARVHLATWATLRDRVEAVRPVAVVVDTLQYVASTVGSDELDSAMAVDRILRPLQELARETGAAVTVTDHEPWAEGRHGDRETGTNARPRHSGAKVATADAVLRVTAAKDDDDQIVCITIRPSKAKGARRGISVSTEHVDIHGFPTDPPAGGGNGGGRPSSYGRILDEVRGYLDGHPTASKREVRRSVPGKHDHVDQAFDACQSCAPVGNLPVPETVPETQRGTPVPPRAPRAPFPYRGHGGTGHAHR